MGRTGWRVYSEDGEHVGTSYADQYTLDELKDEYARLYPGRTFTFVPITLTRDNRY